jgi:peroxiredoxin
MAETPAGTGPTRAARPSTQSDQTQAMPSKAPETEIVRPEVLLSADHAGTCHVSVGDVFPDLSLASLQGEPTSLQAHLGQRLTIVVFWNAHQPMSVEQILHLQQEFAEIYQGAGVSVVTINVANSAEDARGRVPDDAAGGFVHLHDTDGSAFAQVATTLLPRTYLLRSDRRVVWFDMEYSRSTSRELRNAILYVLQQFEQQASSGSPSLM